MACVEGQACENQHCIPSVGWAAGFGGANEDEPAWLAASDERGVFIATHMTGESEFFGMALEPLGLEDVVIGNVDAAGDLAWVERHGGPSSDRPTGIDVDSSGHVYVTGIFDGSANLGGADLTSRGGVDAFAASYFGAGGHRWSHALGSSGNDRSGGVVLGPADEVLMSVQHSTTLVADDWNVEALSGPTLSGVSLRPDGTVRWAEIMGELQDGFVTDLGTSSDGHVLFAGSSYAELSFGMHSAVNAGDIDGFAGSYARGDTRWLLSASTAGAETANAVAGGSDGTVYLAGTFDGSLSIGGIHLDSAGATDIYLAALEGLDGSPIWATAIGGAGSEAAGGLTCDDAGNVYLAGSFESAFDVGGVRLESLGDSDALVMRYGSNGMLQWATTLGGPSIDRGGPIAVASDRTIYVSGSFGDAVTVGETTLVASGENDTFVLQVLQ